AAWRRACLCCVNRYTVRERASAAPRRHRVPACGRERGWERMSTTWVKVGYGILLGLVLALTAGFGAATFISEPRPPQPVGITFQQISSNSSDTENQREAKQIDSYFNDVQSYRGKYPDYQRNIFLAFAIAGLVLGIVGVALPSIVNYLRLGFLVGGGILLAAGTWFVIQPVPLGTENPSGILTLLVVGTPNVLD